MIKFDNTYINLSPDFYTIESAQTFSAPLLLTYNRELATELGITITDEQTLAKVFSGQLVLPDSAMFAQAYAGHQFGHFVPRLGDGRALMLGEVLSKDGHRYDIQLKGSGRTSFSRGGDGLSPIGPVLREYLVSEAMHALSIPTTRSLAMVATGDPVYREETFPGAVLTRVSNGHIRVGTFEYFACRNQTEHVEALADYCIKRFYPHFENHEDKYFEFFKAVSQSLVSLVNKWLSVGFIHGVMNTDNTSICGETIDYGPCAFMDTYNEGQVYSYIDRHGRYAYKNQPLILQWNLTRLADCLIPLIDSDSDRAIHKLQHFINSLSDLHNKEYLENFSKKLGISNAKEDDRELIDQFLKILQDNKLDFTNSFRELSQDNHSLMQYEGFQKFNKKRLARIADIDESLSLMRSTNPFIIPRNHLIEKMIDQVVHQSSFDLFFKLHKRLLKPFEETDHEFTSPPSDEEIIANTFCGT
jgi:uncharacterized protein YdiU (UPF0061 family)